jgi:hypothetical protein
MVTVEKSFGSAFRVRLRWAWGNEGSIGNLMMKSRVFGVISLA